MKYLYLLYNMDTVFEKLNINKTPFIKAMINSQYLILDILNDMKQYQITVYLEEIEIIKMQFNL